MPAENSNLRVIWKSCYPLTIAEDEESQISSLLAILLLPKPFHSSIPSPSSPPFNLPPGQSRGNAISGEWGLKILVGEDSSNGKFTASLLLEFD